MKQTRYTISVLMLILLICASIADGQANNRLTVHSLTFVGNHAFDSARLDTIALFYGMTSPT
jgi:hypothetical protein